MCNAGLNLRFFRQFRVLIFGNLFKSEESFFSILQTKNPLEILETFFKPEKFFPIVKNKKSNFNTRVYTV